MSLSQDDLRILTQNAIAAAYQAGHLIQTYTQKHFTKSIKPDANSPASQIVTEVDLKSEAIILSSLKASIDRYDLGLLTEEQEDDGSRFEKEYFWCIDPLDGTLAFSEGQFGYSVSIALVKKDGTPQIGVVYDPLNQNLYHATTSQGAYRNSEAWTPAPLRSPGKRLTLLMDPSLQRHQRYEEALDLLSQTAKALGLDGIETICQGGAAMKACRLIELGAACYFKFPSDTPGGGSLWDFAATSCIFTEMGAYHSNASGESLDLNCRATTYMNPEGVLYGSHEEVVQSLKDLGARVRG